MFSTYIKSLTCLLVILAIVNMHIATALQSEKDNDDSLETIRLKLKNLYTWIKVNAATRNENKFHPLDFFKPFYNWDNEGIVEPNAGDYVDIKKQTIKGDGSTNIKQDDNIDKLDEWENMNVVQLLAQDRLWRVVLIMFSFDVRTNKQLMEHQIEAKHKSLKLKKAEDERLEVLKLKNNNGFFNSKFLDNLFNANDTKNWIFFDWSMPMEFLSSPLMISKFIFVWILIIQLYAVLKYFWYKKRNLMYDETTGEYVRREEFERNLSRAYQDVPIPFRSNSSRIIDVDPTPQNESLNTEITPISPVRSTNSSVGIESCCGCSCGRASLTSLAPSDSTSDHLVSNEYSSAVNNYHTHYEWFDHDMESYKDYGTDVTPCDVTEETSAAAYPEQETGGEQPRTCSITFADATTESYVINGEYATELVVGHRPGRPRYIPAHGEMMPMRSILRNSGNTAGNDGINSNGFVMIPSVPLENSDSSDSSVSEDIPSRNHFINAVDSLTIIRGVPRTNKSKAFASCRGDLSPGVICNRNNFRTSEGISEVSDLVSNSDRSSMRTMRSASESRASTSGVAPQVDDGQLSVEDYPDSQSDSFFTCNPSQTFSCSSMCSGGSCYDLNLDNSCETYSSFSESDDDIALAVDNNDEMYEKSCATNYSYSESVNDVVLAEGNNEKNNEKDDATNSSCDDKDIALADEITNESNGKGYATSSSDVESGDNKDVSAGNSEDTDGGHDAINRSHKREGESIKKDFGGQCLDVSPIKRQRMFVRGTMNPRDMMAESSSEVECISSSSDGSIDEEQ